MKTIDIFDRMDRERALCNDALRIGTFGDKLNKLGHSELESLQDMFHHVVTLLLNNLPEDEFSRRNATVKKPFEELLEAKRRAK